MSLNSSASVSSWSNHLGYNFNNSSISFSGNNFVKIPCGAYINNNLVSKPECYIFDVSSKGYNIIQWMNFGKLNNGDQISLYLLNISYCS
jgi:hypothetical protein